MASLAVAVAVGATGEALAQARQSAVVTHVVDGDTLDARLPDGRTVRVRLIGIDAPEVGRAAECAGERATAYLERLVEGRDVYLVADPTQARLDRYGRFLFYVDRTDGLDAGEAMLRAGLANVFVVEQDFARLPTYRVARVEARDSDAGAWQLCDGDFHRSDERSAEAFVRRYYRRLSQRRFRTAWAMLGARLHRQFGSYRRWRGGYRRSLGTAVISSRARLSGSRAVVRVALRSRDRDACNGRVIRQRFRGRWLLARRDGSWVGIRVNIRKTAGRRVRVLRSECRRARPRPAPRRPRPPERRPERRCHPSYSPCIPADRGDVDCGELPLSNYRVTGPDEYGLDRDNDGVGCDS